MNGYVIVFLGAGLGGMARHAINVGAMRLGGTFPWHTLAINVVGSLLMGMLIGWLSFRADASQSWRLFVATGILGGFTTFSAFSLDAALLWERGQAGLAAFYVVSSVALSLAALGIGLTIMRGISS